MGQRRALASFDVVAISTGHPRRSPLADWSVSVSPKKKSELEPPALERHMLLVTGVWTWARDRRFPRLASWFNAQVAAGHVLIRDLVILELTRLTPNKARAEGSDETTRRVPGSADPANLWTRAREVQLLLASSGDHRRVHQSTC